MSSTANTKQSSKLPTPWIEKIFRQLQGRFGNSFTNKYATGQIIEEKQLDQDGNQLFDKNGVPLKPVIKDLGIENAKSVWASQLGHLSGEEIAKGLEANYTYPPSCDDFIKAALSIDCETLFNEAVKGHSARRSKNKDDDEFIWTSPLAYWAGVEFGVTDLLATNYQRSQTRWNHCVEKAISQNKKTAPVPPTPAALPPAEHVKDSPIAKEVVGKVLGRMGSSNGREHWLSVVESPDFDKTPAITKQFAIDTLKKLNVPLPEKLQKYVYEGLKL